MMMRMVKTRIQEHCSNIRCKRSATKMTNHFVQNNHTVEELRWTVIEQLRGKGTQIERRLLECEQRWIYSLSTFNQGLNEEIPWSNIQFRSTPD